MIPIGAYAGTMMLIFPYLAYRFENMRGYLYLVAQLLTTAASLILWLVPLSAVGALLFGAIILPSTGAGYAVLMGHSLANTAGYTKRTLSSSGLYIGYCLGMCDTTFALRSGLIANVRELGRASVLQAR